MLRLIMDNKVYHAFELHFNTSHVTVNRVVVESVMAANYHFNTSHVTVNQYISMDQTYRQNFNTSHVTVNQKGDFIVDDESVFQYISCYG